VEQQITKSYEKNKGIKGRQICAGKRHKFGRGVAAVN
jgi:hypothetical protein